MWWGLLYFLNKTMHTDHKQNPNQAKRLGQYLCEAVLRRQLSQFRSLLLSTLLLPLSQLGWLYQWYNKGCCTTWKQLFFSWVNFLPCLPVGKPAKPVSWGSKVIQGRERIRPPLEEQQAVNPSQLEAPLVYSIPPSVSNVCVCYKSSPCFSKGKRGYLHHSPFPPLSTALMEPFAWHPALYFKLAL